MRLLIGDKVKIIEGKTKRESVNDYIGKIGTINTIIKYDPKYMVKFEEDNYWFFYEENLGKGGY